jgi:regulator of sigma E protease|tara:strand:- start:572395 stop:573537 length:1143 start_codon:yes stop_codon:yes gene_type:complete
MFEQFATTLSSMPGGSFIWAVLVFTFVIGVLVFIHELGHYLAARSVGVKVETFSIGFGKELFGWYDRKGTRWKVSILPLGGYVKMYAMTGEVNPEDVPEEEKKHAFISKSVLARMWVVFAGPFANFLLAFIVLSGVFYAVGERRILAEVGPVSAEMPAAEAGLIEGDRIQSIGGVEIKFWDELVPMIRENGDKQMRFTVYRPSNDTIHSIDIKPLEKEMTDMLGKTQKVYQIGIQAGSSFERIDHGIVESMRLGAISTYNQTSMILTALWRMVTGQMAADIGGPLTIGKVAGEQATAGFESLLFFMAFISINLGLINLFPVPVLDGGHLVYFAIEGITGRPLNERLQDIANRIGMGLLATLMIFAFYKDILNVILPVFKG